MVIIQESSHSNMPVESTAYSKAAHSTYLALTLLPSAHQTFPHRLGVDFIRLTGLAQAADNLLYRHVRAYDTH